MIAIKRRNRQHERFGIPRTVTHTAGFTAGTCKYLTDKYAVPRYNTLPGLKFRGFGSTRIRDNIADIRHSGNIEEQPVKTEAKSRMRHTAVTA